MGNLADQNEFWLAKCWNWLENGRWPTVISSTACIIRYNVKNHYIIGGSSVTALADQLQRSGDVDNLVRLWIYTRAWLRMSRNVCVCVCVCACVCVCVHACVVCVVLQCLSMYLYVWSISVCMYACKQDVCVCVCGNIANIIKLCYVAYNTAQFKLDRTTCAARARHDTFFISHSCKPVCTRKNWWRQTLACKALMYALDVCTMHACMSGMHTLNLYYACTHIVSQGQQNKFYKTCLCNPLMIQEVNPAKAYLTVKLKWFKGVSFTNYHR